MSSKRISPRGLRISAVLSLVWGTISYAQQSAPPSAPSAADAGLAEVTVTAERREESLQKSSVAMQVLSADQLSAAGVTQPQDLGKLVPGMQISTGGALPQVYIRGVGDFSTTAISNPAVPFNVDGVYVARSQSMQTSFYDIQRIEVLMGPQGTLYGRNASGGAINVLTNRPELGAFGGDANLEIGNYSNFNTDAAVNLPFGQTIALRIAGQLVRRDGYLSDGMDDDHHEGERLELLLQPHDDLSLLIGADYGHQGGRGEGFALGPNELPGHDPWLSVGSAAANAAFTAMSASDYAAGFGNPPSSLVSAVNTSKAYQDNRFWSAHAELNWNLGFATLTVLPAYRNTRLVYSTYPDFAFEDGVAGPPETSKETTAEARLSNNSDQIKWVGGLYYYNENQYSNNLVYSGLVQNNYYQASFNTRSYAGFGQATYSLTDALRLIGGVRYTTDERSIYDGSVTALAPSYSQGGFPSSCVSTTLPDGAGYLIPPGAPNCLLETYAGARTFRAFNWKLGLEYDVATDHMVYATAATGFKAGGFNEGLSSGASSSSTEASSYDPEKLTAFELGSRNRFLNDRLQINGEVFYWLYHDHQEPHIVLDNLGVVGLDIANAGSARQYGTDLSVLAKPTRDDTVQVTVEYLDSRYNTFTYTEPAAFIYKDSTGCRETVTGQMSAAGPIAVVDCSGFELTHAPKFSGSIVYSHTFALPNGATLVPQLAAEFATARWLASDFIAAERAPSYVTEDATLTYHAQGNRWSLMAYCRNLSNRPLYTGAEESPFVPGFVGVNLGPPRTYGGKVSVTF